MSNSKYQLIVRYNQRQVDLLNTCEKTGRENNLKCREFAAFHLDEFLEFDLPVLIDRV